jgi:hypothetical protein
MEPIIAQPQSASNELASNARHFHGSTGATTASTGEGRSAPRPWTSREWGCRVVATCFPVLLTLLGGCTAESPLPWDDDFSNPASGWRAEADDSALVAYGEGVMQIVVHEPNHLAWTAAGRDLSDVLVTVEATQVDGPDDNEYGVLMRLQDNDHFYCFAISGDGYFRIALYQDEDRELLSGDWLPSRYINRGQATNLLEVSCEGDRLTFLVNGFELGQVRDGALDHGDVGLYAGAFFQPGVEIHFDNFEATAP